MSFQFRRRGDVREQSPQQEPFFQNSSNQQNIIDSTLYLDKVEELYNNTLKVYQERNK